jgi:hypothetical protein
MEGRDEQREMMERGRSRERQEVWGGEMMGRR